MTESQPELVTYVWENELGTVYDSFVLCVAHSEESAWWRLYGEDPTAWWALQGRPSIEGGEGGDYAERAAEKLRKRGEYKFTTAIEPTVVDEEECFVLWGDA